MGIGNMSARTMTSKARSDMKKKLFPPFDFLKSSEYGSGEGVNSNALQNFWGHSGEDSFSVVISVIHHILRRLMETHMCDHTVAHTLSYQLEKGGALTSLWTFFQEWLGSDKASYLVSLASAEAANNTSTDNVDGPLFFEADTMSELDWTTAMYACWCLQLLGLCENRYHEAHGVTLRRDKSVAYETHEVYVNGKVEMHSLPIPDEISVWAIADDLLHTLLSYCFNVLQEVNKLVRFYLFLPFLPKFTKSYQFLPFFG